MVVLCLKVGPDWFFKFKLNLIVVMSIRWLQVQVWAWNWKLIQNNEEPKLHHFRHIWGVQVLLPWPTKLASLNLSTSYVKLVLHNINKNINRFHVFFSIVREICECGEGTYVVGLTTFVVKDLFGYCERDFMRGRKSAKRFLSSRVQIEGFQTWGGLWFVMAYDSL